MGERIRKAGIDDFEPLMRFLEKSYGHRRNFFSEHYGHLLKDVPGAGEDVPHGSFILEKNNKILSHVGLAPIEIVSGGIRCMVGGIGGVATSREARGRGYMGLLLRHAISLMEKHNIPLSALWGDRHRYGNFGWERAGEKINLSFSERSLSKSGVKPVKNIEEVQPGDALSRIKKLHKNIPFRVERGKNFKRKISRLKNRVWLSKDGYLCGTEQNGLKVNEVFSHSGKEAGMVLACMEWSLQTFASIYVSPNDRRMIDKLLPPAENWAVVSEGMFRINDAKELLRIFSPLLEQRAEREKLKDFSISLKVAGGERGGDFAVSCEGGKIRVGSSVSGKAVPVAEKDAVRLFLGGPVIIPAGVEPLAAILPLPVHVPALDRV